MQPSLFPQPDPEPMNYNHKIIIEGKNKIYVAENGTCSTSQNECWITGIFENEKTAREAFNLPDSVLHELQNIVNENPEFDKRVISYEMVMEKIKLLINYDMRTLTLIHPKGNAYWQDGEYQIKLPNGEMLDFVENTGGGIQTWSYKITVTDEGIVYDRYACGTGYGKKRVDDGPYAKHILLVPKSEYDEIVYEGEPLVISDIQADEIKKYKWPME